MVMGVLPSPGWRLGDDLVSEQDVMDIVPRQPGLNVEPGTDWLHSNTGFTLAAVIVQRVTGTSMAATRSSQPSTRVTTSAYQLHRFT